MGQYIALTTKTSLVNKSAAKPFIEWNGNPLCSGNPVLIDTFRGPIVRRPINGITVKEDTHAHIEVLKGSTNIPIFNAVGSSADPMDYMMDTKGNVTLKEKDLTTGPNRGLTSNYYTDFSIQQVIETRMEKQQIVETFGEPYLFVFGERPRSIEVSGVLVNTLDFNWRAEFWRNYDTYLRGTKLVEMGAQVLLSWDDIVVRGYMLNAQAQETANTPGIINFSFTLLVTEYLSLATLFDSVYEKFRSTALLGNIPPEYLGALEIQNGSVPVRIGNTALEGMLGMVQNGLGTLGQVFNDPKNFLVNTALQAVNSFGNKADSVIAAAMAGNAKAGLEDQFGHGIAGMGATPPVVRCYETQYDRKMLEGIVSTVRSFSSVAIDIANKAGFKIDKTNTMKWIQSPGGIAKVFGTKVISDTVKKQSTFWATPKTHSVTQVPQKTPLSTTIKAPIRKNPIP